MTLFELPEVADHPAPYPPEVLHLFDRILHRHGKGQRLRVLDGFAGTGRIHRLDHDTVGIELERLWVNCHHRTIQGDATRLPFADASFDAYATSPAYGNRMADQYDGRDGSERHTYRIAHGGPLHPRSGAAMQWGDPYRRLHTEAWQDAYRALKPGGLILVNVGDHIRHGETVHVTRWHAETLNQIGFVDFDWAPVPTTGLPHGENHDARTAGEWIIAATKPGKAS